MLKSFILNHPKTDQAVQLTKLAMVKGNGIEAADCDSITCFKAESGDANIMIQKNTCRRSNCLCEYHV